MRDQNQQYWDILGNRRIIRYLGSALERNKIVSAYLFWGPPQVGKSTVARLFLQRLLCQSPRSTDACGNCFSCVAWVRHLHPDAAILADSGETLGVDAIRELQQHLAHRPTSGRSTVALVERAERMTNEASNALLKTLEDPLGETVLVLTTDRPHLLPATLRSRCQQVEFQPVAEAEILAATSGIIESREEALEMTRLAFGRPGRAFTLAREPLSYQEHRRDVDGFLHVLDLPFSERQAHIQAFLGTDRAIAHRTVERMAELWTLLLRDILLLHLNLPDQITHTAVREILQHHASRFSVPVLRKLIAMLGNVRTALRRRVNPQLLVENFFVHI